MEDPPWLTLLALRARQLSLAEAFEEADAIATALEGVAPGPAPDRRARRVLVTKAKKGASQGTNVKRAGKRARAEKRAAEESLVDWDRRVRATRAQMAARSKARRAVRSLEAAGRRGVGASASGPL